MRKDPSTLIFGALVVVALGSIFVMMPSGSHGTPASADHAEFPHDWFAPGTDEELAGQAKLIGHPMPALDLSHWQNGERSVEDLKGKVVVLDFWATWCAPCIAAFPDNNKLYADWKSKGVEFIGICTNTGQEKFEQIVTDKKPEYPQAQDEKQNTMNAWSAKTYPTYAVVDRKGNLRAIGLKHEYIQNVVEKLLAEPAS